MPRDRRFVRPLRNSSRTRELFGIGLRVTAGVAHVLARAVASLRTAGSARPSVCAISANGTSSTSCSKNAARSSGATVRARARTRTRCRRRALRRPRDRCCLPRRPAREATARRRLRACARGAQAVEAEARHDRARHRSIVFDVRRSSASLQRKYASCATSSASLYSPSIRYAWRTSAGRSASKRCARSVVTRPAGAASQSFRRRRSRARTHGRGRWRT